MSLWQYSTIHSCACKVIEEQTLWGQSVCRVWLPNQDAVVRVPRSDLTPLPTANLPDAEAHHIGYLSAAAKVAEVLENSTAAANGHVLLAPMESNVIPLPHQIHALSRALSGDRIRYLLADEVGLGKTIEAGLVLRELKLRGLVRRTLIVVPKSLAIQWVAEMSTHFNEKFALVNPSDLEALERLESPESVFADAPSRESDYNPWLRFSQVIVTLDAVKPLARRKGWSKEKLREYNQTRHEKLVHGNWDLIVVDESHRLGGSTDQVARFKLGQHLAEAAPYLLLLSATPHQGKSDAFQRLMSLLDPMAFPDLDSVTRERVAEYVIRTEKRKAVTDQGGPLFMPRSTKTLKIELSANPRQLALYDAVTEYVKAGYNQAIKDRKPHIGFLMVLLQRIVTSSTQAIRRTLERRLSVLEELKGQSAALPEVDLEELSEMDAQEALDELIEVSEPGRLSEVAQVKRLLSLSREAEASGPDPKTSFLLDLIYRLQGEENDDQLKVLIFTEFVPTQEMLKRFLEERSIPCATLNGSMSMDERRIAQKTFRDKARVLISTDAGGEGLNLQFAHVVINYDLPWNPMRIEQRIGRVDRIGQDLPVRALNFVYADSVEDRVREVLESKLAIILAEIGIDKTNDILDTSLAGDAVEQMMTRVVMADSNPETEVENTLRSLRTDLIQKRQECAVYTLSDEPDLASAERLRTHPLPHWVERMTVSYLRMKGCPVKRTLFGWDLQWPDGVKATNAVFQAKNLSGDALLLSLENTRVRELAGDLPQLASGQPLPRVALRGIPSGLSGLWGLFEIRLQAGNPANSPSLRLPLIRRGFLCAFLGDDGKTYQPTARHIWDALQTEEPQVMGALAPVEAASSYDVLLGVAEETGKDLFESLQQAHAAAIAKEEDRGTVSFGARRKAIEKVGLPEVRRHRLIQCSADEAAWREELDAARLAMPELRALLLLKIEGST